MTLPRFLIVGPAWVGDMVMTQVLVQRLQARFVGSHIDIMGPHWSLGLVARMPGVSKMINADFGHGKLALSLRYQFAKRLRGDYDRAYLIPNSFKSALIPWWAKIPERIGWTGEMRYGLLTKHRALDKKAYPLMVQRIAALSALEGDVPPAIPPQLHVSQAQQQAALSHFGLSISAPILAICPGASFGPSKQWQLTGYAQVAAFYAKKGWRVCLLGSPNEKPFCHEIKIAAKADVLDLSGHTSLTQTIDLLASATAVLTNDSGLMHIASALDRPLVALYGSSSPAFTPPLSEKATVLSAQLPCSPCFKRVCPLGHHDCMKKITPTAVIAALERLCEYS